jgi:hypothetical protein
MYHLKKRLLKRLAEQYMWGLWTEEEYHAQRASIINGSLRDVPEWKDAL